MAAMGYCPSGRLFEAAACGTAILTDAWPGLEQFFTPGEEVLVARDTADTLAALDVPRDELARIAARARERALDEHTAGRRAPKLEEAVENALAAARARDAVADDAFARAPAAALPRTVQQEA